MSSFFTTPASQQKRKRDDTNFVHSLKRRNMGDSVSAKPTKGKPVRARRDESISSSGSEGVARHSRVTEDLMSHSESEDEDETGAEHRLRLAERYLQSLQTEVDEAGFDAEEIDRNMIAERLQEDVAETKGRLYRHLSSTLSFSTAIQTQFRSKSLSITSIATCAPYAYTVSKDLQLTKWEIPILPPRPARTSQKSSKPVRRRPLRLITRRGDKRKRDDPNYQQHIGPILCVAASTTGKYVVTGGADKRLIVWSADKLTPLRVFTQHRDAVTSLSFRRGTNQLYSVSRDRTIKCWSLDELAYIETLFGHQDEVVDIASLALERCVSVGARDRTARLWKVVEETQLVFRGGGVSEKRKCYGQQKGNRDISRVYSEGSIERVAMVDEETFVTGSDNGTISLWALHKKKPIFSVGLAHGLDRPMKPEEVSAEAVPDEKVPERQPRWITALATMPYSDLVLSGSWDGEVRAWKVSKDKKRLDAIGVVGKDGNENGSTDMAIGDKEGGDQQTSVQGIINDISVFEQGDKGRNGLQIVVALGTEPRLGRWKKLKGRNDAVLFEVRRLSDVPEVQAENEGMVQDA